MASRTLHLKIINKDLLGVYNAAITQLNTLTYKANKYKDSGFDLYAPMRNAIIITNKTIIVDLGVQCTMRENGVPQPFYIYPRSSISTTPYRLANSVGIIDSGYRGTLKIALDMNDTNHVPNQLLRLTQICAADLQPFDVVIDNNQPDDTVRGGGGFGSTGLC
jgi:dUTP pyrophosphatase